MSRLENQSSVTDFPNDGRNKYLSKKTIAQGMFDVALLSSNTNQLVHLLEIQRVGESTAFHIAAISLLITSIILQIIVGGLLIVTAMTNTRNPTRKIIARRLNTVTILLIFFITVINVLIPSFTPSFSQSPKII